MNHNYKPLTTFRGWSEEQNGWVYGSLCGQFIVDAESIDYTYWERQDAIEGYGIFVHKDSIGIYTGRDDANGTPIFCGVDGALYGGDIVRQEFLDTIFNDPIISVGCVAYGDSAFFQIDELNQTTNQIMSTALILSSQYEQHLKEK